MAKMLSNFAINSLGMQADTGKVCNFTDMGTESKEMQFYAILACQLGLMGVKPDGTSDTTFHPENTVTRGQFGTALSRIIR